LIMSIPEINNYIEKRYIHWLEYSKHQCSCAGIQGEEIDLLNDVMEHLLRNSESKLQELFSVKKIQKGKEYTELDFFVLSMIKRNCYSETAPYKAKNKPIPRAKKDLNRLNIPDIIDEDTDHSGYVLERMREIRQLIESMGFSEKAMAIFEYRFFEDGSVKDCPNLGKPKEIYCIYGRIMKLLKKKINGE